MTNEQSPSSSNVTEKIVTVSAAAVGALLIYAGVENPEIGSVVIVGAAIEAGVIGSLLAKLP